MEHRKIQKVGGMTYTISLPKKWVKEQGLKRGDEIGIREEAGGLVLLAGKPAAREFIIDVDEGLAYRRMLTGYLSGYNQLVVKSKGRISRAQKKEIKTTLQRLVGMEIVEERANEIVLKDLLDPNELDVKKAIIQEYKIAASIHKDSVSALKEGDRELAKEVLERDTEVDRLYFLTIRQLKRALVDSSHGLTAAECMDLRLLAKNIEELGDAGCNIARRVEDLGKVNVTKLSDEFFAFHEKAFAAFFSRDVKAAERLRLKRVQLRKKKERTYGKFPAAILDELDNIAECGVNIADLVI